MTVSQLEAAIQSAREHQEARERAEAMLSIVELEKAEFIANTQKTIESAIEEASKQFEEQVASVCNQRDNAKKDAEAARTVARNTERLLQEWIEKAKADNEQRMRLEKSLSSLQDSQRDLIRTLETSRVAKDEKIKELEAQLAEAVKKAQQPAGVEVTAQAATVQQSAQGSYDEAAFANLALISASAELRQAHGEIVKVHKKLETRTKERDDLQKQVWEHQRRLVKYSTELEGSKRELSNLTAEFNSMKKRVQSTSTSAVEPISIDLTDDMPLVVSDLQQISSSAKRSAPGPSGSDACVAPNRNVNNRSAGESSATKRRRTEDSIRNEKSMEPSTETPPLSTTTQRLFARVSGTRALALDSSILERSPTPWRPFMGYVSKEILVALYGIEPGRPIRSLALGVCHHACRNVEICCTHQAPRVASGPSHESCRPAWYFPTDLHWGLPSSPGQPGVFFSTHPPRSRRTSRFFSLFRGSPGILPTHWLYLGEYTVAPDFDLLSAGEWRSLPSDTRENWVNALSTPALPSSCVGHNRQCWEMVVAKVIQRRKQENIVLGITEEDVRKALDSGEEQLVVLRLVPVTFNKDWYMELQAAASGELKKNPRQDKLFVPGWKATWEAKVDRSRQGRSIEYPDFTLQEAYTCTYKQRLAVPHDESCESSSEESGYGSQDPK
ncbi:unnamed protein product [Peniophora sp. CBMAI 1063]|nr:unnamed protein product [Peniophora sp. CBMAI 1063]